MGSRVYIGRIPDHVRERDVERFFRDYGRIREVLLKYGYGFVEFEDYRDADDAVYELNGKDLCGARVLVEHARGSAKERGGGFGGGRYERSPPRRGGGGGRGGREKYGPPVRTEYRLIIENLSSRVSWQDLKDLMRQAGEVTYADAHKQNKNEGIVEFATFKDMQNAIDKFDDTELNGRRLKMVEEKRGGGKKRSRSRSRSRSRGRRSRRRSSRSYSRSRSRSRSNSRSKSRDRKNNRSRSKSHDSKKSRSHSRSRSPRSISRSKSRSKSKSPPHRNQEDTNNHDEPRSDEDI